MYGREITEQKQHKTSLFSGSQCKYWTRVLLNPWLLKSSPIFVPKCIFVLIRSSCIYFIKVFLTDSTKGKGSQFDSFFVCLLRNYSANYELTLMINFCSMIIIFSLLYLSNALQKVKDERNYCPTPQVISLQTFCVISEGWS